MSAEFRDGDILLVKVNHFRTWYRWLLAKLIQLFDRNYYHHCVLYVAGVFHEADASGVIIRSRSWYSGDEICLLRPIHSLSPSDLPHYISLANAQLGKPYDYWGTLLFQLIYRLTFRFIWLGKRGNNANKKLYCSEHCITPYHELRGWFPKPWKISPGDLRRSSGYFQVVFEGRLN